MHFGKGSSPKKFRIKARSFSTGTNLHKAIGQDKKISILVGFSKQKLNNKESPFLCESNKSANQIGDFWLALLLGSTCAVGKFKQHKSSWLGAVESKVFQCCDLLGRNLIDKTLFSFSLSLSAKPLRLACSQFSYLFFTWCVFHFSFFVCKRNTFFSGPKCK